MQKISKFPQFFLKQKRIIFLIFLLFIVLGTILPDTAMGAWWEYLIPVWNSWALLRDVGGAVASATTSAVASIMRNVFYAILLGLSYLSVLIGQQVAAIASSIFSYVIGPILRDPSWAITRNEFFLSSWAIVRDWANMLIVVGLIGIAIATILNFEKYRAQKLLVSLIIVALLVNFSIVFVGLTIDASNIVMTVLLQGVSNSEMTIVTDVDRGYEREVANLPTDNATQVFEKVGKNIFFAIIYIVIALSFLYFGVVMIERYVILSALFILSPLAFVFFAFPVEKAKELFGQWWHNFVKWCFVGVGAVFFLKISTQMLGAGRISTGGQGLANLVVALGFLIIGLKLSKKAAGPIADTVIGLAKTAGMTLATGGAALAGKIGKWTADNTGLTRAKNTAQYYATRAGEGMRLVNRGQAMATWQKKQRGGQIDDKDRQERTKHMDAQTKVANLRAGAWTQEGHLDNAAILKSMTKEEMNLLNHGEQMQFMQKYQTYGVKPHEIVDKLSAVNQNQIIAGVPGMQFDAKTKATAMNSLAANGQLDPTIPGSLSPGQIAEAMQEMLDNGSSVENVIKGLDSGNIKGMLDEGLFDPNAANRLFDPQTRNKILKTIADKKLWGLMDASEKQNALLEAQVQQYKPKDLVSGMESTDLAGIINSDQNLISTGHEPIFDEQTRTAAGNTLLKRRDFDLVNAGNRNEAVREMVSNGVDIEEIEKLDHNYAPLNRARRGRIEATAPAIGATITKNPATGKDLATPMPVTAANRNDIIDDMARSEVLNKNIGSYDFDQLRQIDVRFLSSKRIQQLTPEKIEAAYQYADPATKAHLQGPVMMELSQDWSEASDQYDDAVAAGEEARANKSLEKMTKLDKLIRAIHDLT